MHASRFKCARVKLLRFSLIGSRKVYIPYRSLIEALYTLNSPPEVSFNRVKVYTFEFDVLGLLAALTLTCAVCSAPKA